jgi:hypothetical protein
MNTYDRFRLSMQAEFQRKAHTQVRVLWADLEELEEATDGQARTVTLWKIHQRVCALEYAAYAVDAPEVRAVSKVVLSTLVGIAVVRLATRPELFATLEEAMTKLAEAVCSVEAKTPAFGRRYQPTHAALVESLPD